MPSKPSSNPSPKHPWFATPSFIRQLFDTFPLRTLPPNHLPARTLQTRAHNTLYIFTTPTAARTGAPSFNPTCLRWQTYLLFSGLTFTTAPSNNHASPSGTLPFLLPASSKKPAQETPVEAPAAIPAGKDLRQWAHENTPSAAHNEPPDPSNEANDMRYTAYLTLLDNRIRNAWLYNFYLHPPNAPLVPTFYINPTTTSLPVRLALTSQLRSAARLEILKSHHGIDPPALYDSAASAFAALATCLGEDEWFFGAKEPGMLDAAVFAYTHLLLDEEEMGWGDTGLGRGVRECGNLVRHRRRIWKRCFAEREREGLKG